MQNPQKAPEIRVPEAPGESRAGATRGRRKIFPRLRENHQNLGREGSAGNGHGLDEAPRPARLRGARAGLGGVPVLAGAADPRAGKTDLHAGAAETLETNP